MTSTKSPDPSGYDPAGLLASAAQLSLDPADADLLVTLVAGKRGSEFEIFRLNPIGDAAAEFVAAAARWGARLADRDLSPYSAGRTPLGSCVRGQSA